MNLFNLRKIISLGVILSFTFSNVSFAPLQIGCRRQPSHAGTRLSLTGFAFAGSNLRTEQPSITGVAKELTQSLTPPTTGKEFFVGGQEVDWNMWERDPGNSNQIRQKDNPSVVAKRQADGKFAIFSGGKAVSHFPRILTVDSFNIFEGPPPNFIDINAIKEVRDFITNTKNAKPKRLEAMSYLQKEFDGFQRVFGRSYPIWDDWMQENSGVYYHFLPNAEQLTYVEYFFKSIGVIVEKAPDMISQDIIDLLVSINKKLIDMKSEVLRKKIDTNRYNELLQYCATVIDSSKLALAEQNAKLAQAPQKDFPNQGLTGKTPTGVGPVAGDSSGKVTNSFPQIFTVDKFDIHEDMPDLIDITAIQKVQNFIVNTENTKSARLEAMKYLQGSFNTYQRIFGEGYQYYDIWGPTGTFYAFSPGTRDLTYFNSFLEAFGIIAKKAPDMISQETIDLLTRFKPKLDKVLLTDIKKKNPAGSKKLQQVCAKTIESASSAFAASKGSASGKKKVAQAADKPAELVVKDAPAAGGEDDYGDTGDFDQQARDSIFGLRTIKIGPLGLIGKETLVAPDLDAGLLNIPGARYYLWDGKELRYFIAKEAIGRLTSSTDSTGKNIPRYDYRFEFEDEEGYGWTIKQGLGDPDAEAITLDNQNAKLLQAFLTDSNINYPCYIFEFIPRPEGSLPILGENDRYFYAGNEKQAYATRLANMPVLPIGLIKHNPYIALAKMAHERAAFEAKQQGKSGDEQHYEGLKAEVDSIDSQLKLLEAFSEQTLSGGTLQDLDDQKQKLLAARESINMRLDGLTLLPSKKVDKLLSQNEVFGKTGSDYSDSSPAAGGKETQPAFNPLYMVFSTILQSVLPADRGRDHKARSIKFDIMPGDVAYRLGQTVNEIEPYIRILEEWGLISVTPNPYGEGFSISPIQLTTAAATNAYKDPILVILKRLPSAQLAPAEQEEVRKQIAQILGTVPPTPAGEELTAAEKEAAFVAQDFLKAVEKWRGAVDWKDTDIEGIEKITVDLPTHYSEPEALLAGLKQRVGDKISVTVRIRGADANTHQYYKNLNSQLNLGFAIQPVLDIMESSSEFAGSLLRKGLPSNERYLFVIEELDNFEFQRQEETLAALVRSTASLGNNAKNVKVALVRKVAQDMVQPTDATPKILKDLLFGEKQIEVITPETITGDALREELSTALEALRKA